MACILACLAKRQSRRSMDFQSVPDERNAARYAFFSYILSKGIHNEILIRVIPTLGLISIGLTMAMIMAVLLYFFIRDLYTIHRNPANTNHYKGMTSLKYRNLVDHEYLTGEGANSEDIEMENPSF